MNRESIPAVSEISAAPASPTEIVRERVKRTRKMMVPDDPLVSIVIPVFNESKILRAAVHNLMAEVTDRFDWEFELILAENGSKDGTTDIALELAQRYPNLRVVHYPQPNYGAALREAIRAAKGEFVICDEIDLCDTVFYRRALELLESGQADFVVGSKTLAEAEDDRPLFRRFATWVLNTLLRVLVGFRGTDTHGLKAFHRTKLSAVVDACRLDRDIFASELVIRAERAYVKKVEVPIKLREIRPPSVALLKRVPRALRQIFQLALQLRVKG